MRPAKWNLLFGAILVLANVFAFNGILSNFHGGRMDLTERGDWTLAPETVEILREPEEPLEIYFFFTPLEKQHQLLRPLIPLMSDSLREMEAASEGHVKLHLIDWDTADKELQTRAGEDFGVKPVTVPIRTADESTTRLTYFSMVIRYGDRSERYDMSDLYRVINSDADTGVVLGLQNIEYLVAKGITKVVRGFASIGASLLTSGETANVTVVITPSEQMPAHMKDLEGRMRKVLDRLAMDAGGKLKSEFVDPTGKTPEKSALRARLKREHGVREIPLDLEGNEKVWPWVIVKVGKKSDVFPLFSYSEEISEATVREALEGTLKGLIPGFLTVVGVVSPDPKPDPMAQMMGKPEAPGEFRQLNAVLGTEYEMKDVDLNSGSPVPADVSVLLILRPKDMTERALYEIDRFVMRGGRLVVCADTHGVDVQGSMAEQALKMASTDLGTFKELLASWGADVGEGVLVDTRCDKIAIPKTVMIAGQRVQVMGDAKHPAMLYFASGEGMTPSSQLTGGLASVTLAYAAPVTVSEARPAAESRPAKTGKPATVTTETFLTTSAESGSVSDVASADALLDAGYKASGNAKERTVGLVLRGKFPSWFAGKPVPGLPPKKEGAQTRPADDEDSGPPPSAISKDTTMVVIGDADFISPLFMSWTDLSEALKGNVALLRNAIDIGGSDPALLKIRSREDMRRPLTALRKMPEADRASATSLARWLALVFPLGILLVLGVVWRVIQAQRKSIDLTGMEG